METKIILPTRMVSSLEEREGEPGRLFVTESYDKYSFTIAEAIDYMNEPWRIYMFEEMILHNVSLRNEMRRVGAKKLVEYIRSISNPSENLEASMREFVGSWEGKDLENIDIQVVPTGVPFVVDGVLFDGLDELAACVEKSYQKSAFDDAVPMEVASVGRPKRHVGLVWEEYPRFDIYDCGDNRKYCNYLIRRESVSDEELHAVGDIARTDCCAVREDTPAHLLPLVYYEGDGGFMLVAQKHK